MAQKFIQLEEAAEMLGISKERLGELRERGDVHAYRDGAGWKFKQEEVDRLKSALESGGTGDDNDNEFDVLDDLDLTDADEGADSILLSEVELGDSSPGPSSTIIGKSEELTKEDSDITLGAETKKSESDLELVVDDGDARPDDTVTGSDVQLSGRSASGSSDVLASDSEMGEPSGSAPTKGSGLGSKFEDLDELELDLESESGTALGDVETTPAGSDKGGASDALSLDDDDLVPVGEGSGGSGASNVASGSDKGSDKGGGGSATSESTLELAADEDDDLVLGEGSGSDITLSSGDSGIGLAALSDSGLSLDEPVELSGSTTENLELSDDVEISLADEEADTEAPTQLKADDDFMLTPLDDAGADDDGDSGSQVIALDSESFDESADTLLGGGAALGEAEDLEDFGQPAGFAAAGAAPVEMGPETVPEASYSIWNVMFLFICVVLLGLTGAMLYDLVRNIWSWNEPYALNSALMDGLLELIPLK